MNFTVQANVDGVVHTMDIVVDSLKDLDKALKRFGGYLRAKAQGRFKQQGPGWAPLAEATVGHHMERSVRILQGKLRRELGRAEKKSGADAIARRRSVLDEFMRVHAGRSSTGGKSALDPKLASKLEKRVAKTKEKAGSGPILGRLAASIKVNVSGGLLIVESMAPFSGIQNDGGTAGHGAKIPQREFLALDPGDLDIFENIILDSIEEKLGGE